MNKVLYSKINGNDKHKMTWAKQKKKRLFTAPLHTVIRRYRGWLDADILMGIRSIPQFCIIAPTQQSVSFVSNTNPTNKIECIQSPTP